MNDDFRYECPPYCGGCSCHSNPPCVHCIEHAVEITDEERAENLADLKAEHTRDQRRDERT